MKIFKPEKLALICVISLLAVSLTPGCKERYTRNDPVLKKSVEELTDEDISRMGVVMKTNYGTFTIALHPEWAPKTCRAFVKLVKSSYYMGLTFHEVRRGAWIAGGDPLGDGTGGPGYSLELELPAGPNQKGAVGIYYPGLPLPKPDVAGSQFYVLVSDQSWMDNKYPVFGKVVSGMSAVQIISNVPTTSAYGKPRGYMPLSPVIIEEVYLVARK